MFNSSSSPTITNSTFSGNTAEDYGGAMYNYSSSSPVITNSIFSGNTAANGGAIFNNTVVTGTLDLQLINVTFSYNDASVGGGAIYNTEGSGSLSVTIKNSIFWHNTAPAGAGDNIYSNGGSTSIGYSDVQGGWNGAEVVLINGATVTDLGNNINATPRFVNSRGPDGIAGTLDDNLRLKINPLSPCIDTGKNSYNSTTTDLDGNPRKVDGPDANNTATIDMGAYEKQ
jgi:predicted outer membrane repeat protein